MAGNVPDRSKRAFLRGQPYSTSAPLRPPWTSERLLASACTRCGECIRACPEGVLAWGEGGLPAFDPRQGSGACSFCGACAKACGEELFAGTASPPWSLRAVVESSACLPHAGIHCESCRDACPESAIRFAPRLGGPPLPEVLDDRCSGCGGCLSACPGDALSLRADEEKGQAA